MVGKAVASLTTGLEDAERVTVAFLVAVGAAERGRPTLMFLTKEAVRLALDGVATGVAWEGCPPLPTCCDASLTPAALLRVPDLLRRPRARLGRRAAGKDSGPNAVELVLTALGFCYSVGFAYNAAALGYELEALSFDVEGDLDLRNFVGIEQGQARVHRGPGSRQGQGHVDAGRDPGRGDDLAVLDPPLRKIGGTQPFQQAVVGPVGGCAAPMVGGGGLPGDCLQEAMRM
jgi:hypothetical protein